MDCPGVPPKRLYDPIETRLISQQSTLINALKLVSTATQHELYGHILSNLEFGIPINRQDPKIIRKEKQ